jgi:hypothetical protein
MIYSSKIDSIFVAPASARSFCTFSGSNWGSSDSIQTKKPSSVAFLKFSELKSGWLNLGNPFRKTFRKPPQKRQEAQLIQKEPEPRPGN